MGVSQQMKRKVKVSQPEYVTRDELDVFAETIAKDVTGAIMREIGPALKGIKSELSAIHRNQLDRLESALTDIMSELSALRRNQLDELERP